MRTIDRPKAVVQPVTPPVFHRPVDPLIGRTVGGCRLECRIGSGALAMVYRAIRQADQATVAVKILTDEAAADDDFRARFKREAELCHRLAHPNIITVYDQGQDGKNHFLVMELVDGGSMEESIDRDGPLPWLKAAELFLQLGQALDHLRRHGVIHRDIKPANIIITNAGVAKLIDLGFAKGTLREENSFSPELTLSGVALGSPGYMPPEQVLDAKEVTSAADIYGLGASFYHALSGRPPFLADTVQQVLDQVLSQPPTPLSSLVKDVPPAICALIAWTMHKDPRQRPASPAVFVRELENAVYQPGNIKRVEAQCSRRMDLTTLLFILVPVILLLIAVVRFLMKR